MGIQGLLPFLKKIHTPVNVSQFQGCTVAIDAYCWLHKGAFSCAEKLALGEKTEQYVFYCMKYVDYLLRNGLKPIMVFDGCHLPSKKDVETSRRERRETNRKKAAQLLREGKRTEARECLQRCIDITPQMALDLMNVCRSRGVDCIVAPYEADAQLAYLNKAGIAQIIITEDSDLLLFGCEKVIFKMDFFGNGILIEQSRLNEVVDIQDGHYTFDKFRYMCILSGCDYLPSLPGIGLVKASKLFKVARQTDIRQVLKKLPSYLKMNLVVTEEYIEGFIRADNTFLYQLAFDPLTRKLCPLDPYPPEVIPGELKYAGPYFSNERALQIALGNIDIHNMAKIGDFNPLTYVAKYAKKQTGEMQHMLSMWNPAYRPRGKSGVGNKSDNKTPDRPCLAGKEAPVKNNLTKTRRTPVKRAREAEPEDSVEVKTNDELADLYSAPETQHKKKRFDIDVSDDKIDLLATLDAMDDDDEDAETQPSEKQVLSPSKITNRAVVPVKKTSMTTNDAFALMDQELGVAQAPEEKENGKRLVATPKRNKFAVSALAKRAKFSVDATVAPNVKVEVRSRYFNSGSNSANEAAGNDSASAKDGTKSTPPMTEVVKSPADRSSSLPHVSGLDSTDQFEVNEDEDLTSESTSSSPWLSTRDNSLLSRFSYSSKTPTSTGKLGSSKSLETESAKAKETSSSVFSAPRTQVDSDQLPKLGKAAPSSKMPSGKMSDMSSPGSAFSWSRFKFTRSSSGESLSHSSPGSNLPFKRVMSDSKLTENKAEKTELQHVGANVDTSQPQDTSLTSANKLASENGGDGRQTDATPSLSCSQRSSSMDMDASQRSNLYSIDSDCFPTSQDFVDLTDNASETGSENPSQEIVEKTVPRLGITSSSSSGRSQTLLKSPPTTSSTPRTASGVAGKKCRVSGLARGKKKSTPPVDDKQQQKIKDLFSRFAMQKGKDTTNLQTSAIEKDVQLPLLSSGPETPSDPRCAIRTSTHRNLRL